MPRLLIRHVGLLSRDRPQVAIFAVTLAVLRGVPFISGWLVALVRGQSRQVRRDIGIASRARKPNANKVAGIGMVASASRARRVIPGRALSAKTPARRKRATATALRIVGHRSVLRGAVAPRSAMALALFRQPQPNVRARAFRDRGILCRSGSPALCVVLSR